MLKKINPLKFESVVLHFSLIGSYCLNYDKIWIVHSTMDKPDHNDLSLQRYRQTGNKLVDCQ